MAIAGRVAIVPKGEYSNAVTYDKLDLVMFNNDAYIAKKASTGIEPTNDEYWMLILNNVVAEDLDNIINGTTPVGNANKLGGYEGTKYVRFLGQIADVNFLNDATISYPYECVITTDIASAIGLPPTYWYVKFQPYSMPRAGYSTQVVTPMDPITKVEDPMFRVALGTNWYPWKYYSGGNADTVDGYHASDFVRNTQNYGYDTKNFSSKDINTWVKDGVYAYAPDCTNKPHGSYGTILILAPRTDRIYQLGYDWNESNRPLRFRNSNDSGATWSEWRYLGQGVFLPLDGSVPMPNGLKVQKSNNEPFIVEDTDNAVTNIVFTGRVDDVISRLGNFGFLGPNNPYLTANDGSLLGYVLHTGNSAKVVTSASAPSDTSALWIDTTNKKVKAYIDGAWTAMA